MKKILLMAAVLLSSVGAFAQHEVGSINIQPKVGLNLANVTEVSDSKMRPAFVAGAELEYQATDLLSLSAGLLYSQQGYKLESKDAHTTVTTEWKPAYLNIPIMANVYVAQGLAVKLGVQPGFMVDKNDAKNVKTFDFSIPVGLSYEFNNIQIDGRYNWGLTKLGENWDAKNSVLQFTVAYKFAL